MYALPVGIVFLCLATITVALRLYTRLRLVRKPGWDDLLIVVSLVRCQIPSRMVGIVMLMWVDRRLI